MKIADRGTRAGRHNTFPGCSKALQVLQFIRFAAALDNKYAIQYITLYSNEIFCGRDFFAITRRELPGSEAAPQDYCWQRELFKRKGKGNENQSTGPNPGSGSGIACALCSRLRDTGADAALAYAHT